MADVQPTKIESIKAKILKIVHSDADVNYHLNELVEEVKRETFHAKRKLGNPAVVGLVGFALSSALMQFHNLGWTQDKAPSAVILWCGLVFGGFAQLISGLMEFGTGNNFGFCAFTSYGAFWIAFAGINFWNRFAPSPIAEEDLSLFLLVFAIYTLVMLIGASRENLALFLVFLFLFVGLVLLVASHFAIKYEQDHDHAIRKTAGAILLIDAVGPLYITAHIIYKDGFKYDVLPVGPPLNELFFKRNMQSIPTQA